MRISKKLYIEESVSRPKFIIWKLRKNKRVDNIYCIIYKDDSFLEIINSNKIKDKHSKCILIGIAGSKQLAMELLAQIFQEVYVPNPDIQHMKEYFI